MVHKTSTQKTNGSKPKAAASESPRPPIELTWDEANTLVERISELRGLNLIVQEIRITGKDDPDAGIQLLLGRLARDLDLLSRALENRLVEAASSGGAQ